MPNQIRNDFVSRENLFSIGKYLALNCYILSIPVSNSMVDYEEFYRIDENQYTHFMKDTLLAKAFADECRSRQHDDLLTIEPGKDRGMPR
jgi:hypothetical protein